MSAICRFCGREYANAQAVRAHLKGCAAYQARPGKASANDSSPREPRQIVESLGSESTRNTLPATHRLEDKPFDPVQQLAQQLAAERLRLQLREIEEAHADLDRRVETKERERQNTAEQVAHAARIAVRERQNAQRQADDRNRARESHAARESERQKRRREIVQEIKNRVIGQWYAPIDDRSDLKSSALQEIERELSALQVEDLPQVELVLIAEGVRDRIYREAVQAKQCVQDLESRRNRLIENGCTYASQELRHAEAGFGETLRIERLVREELAEVEGNETPIDIEAWVDEILDDEGIGWDEDDD